MINLKYCRVNLYFFIGTLDSSMRLGGCAFAGKNLKKKLSARPERARGQRVKPYFGTRSLWGTLKQDHSPVFGLILELTKHFQFVSSSCGKSAL